MMDRVLLWEMSQIRRRDLLELARAVKPRGHTRHPGAVARTWSFVRNGWHRLPGRIPANPILPRPGYRGGITAARR
jgi:hypothetical protein